MWTKLLLPPVCLLTALTVMAEYPPMDIQTQDGQTFQNAIIEGVNPSGIDIGYVNTEGYYVLKGLSFKNLPEDLQERFGYDPQEEQEFEKKVQAYSGKNMESVTEDAKARLERIVREIKAKFAGENITIRPADLRFAIYSGRSSVKVRTVAPTRSGCVVKITGHVSGVELKKDLIQIDGGNLPDDGDWSGFIYPTGLKARYKGEEIPVYTDSLDRAAELVERYLDIYGAYAAANPGEADLSDTAPEQALAGSNNATSQTPADTTNAPQTQDTDKSDDSNDGTLGKVPYYGNNDPYYYSGFGGVYTYYIGLSYRPVCWWNRHHRPPHRPPRPGWDRPPRPGRPDGDRPHRPSRPDGDKPQRPSRPDGDRPHRPNRPDGNRPFRPGTSGRPQVIIPLKRPTQSGTTPPATVTPSRPQPQQPPAVQTRPAQVIQSAKPANTPVPSTPAKVTLPAPGSLNRVQPRSMPIKTRTTPYIIQRSGNFSRLRR